MSDQDPNINEGDRGPEATNPIANPDEGDRDQDERDERDESEQEPGGGEEGTPALDSTPLPPESGTEGAGGVAPTVTGVEPSSGSFEGGDEVTVTGTGFTGATAVNFGTMAATSFEVTDDETLTATSPAGSAGSAVDITVVNGIGVSLVSTADQYSYSS